MAGPLVKVRRSMTRDVSIPVSIVRADGAQWVPSSNDTARAEHPAGTLAVH